MSKQKRFSKFLIIWAGQFISTIGIGLTAFSLGVYAFETTNTATSVALITLFAFTPNILLRPIGGVLADRYDRRLLMIIGDIGAALGLLFIYIMLLFNSLQLVHIYAGVAFSSVFSALQAPAYRASATDLLEEKDYSKGSGLMQLAESAKFLLSPIIAGVLLSITSIDVILIMNMCTYLVAIAALLLVRKRLNTVKIDNVKASWYVELREGWEAICQNRGVLLLVFIISLITFYVGLLETLIGPMLLSFTTAKMLGIFQSISAVGMLVTSLVLGVMTIKRSYSSLLVLGLMLAGIAFALLGVTTHLTWLIAAGVLFLGAFPLINTSTDVLVRRNIPNEKQGRVWGIIGILSQLGFIIAYSIAGLLADTLFNPWLEQGGELADTVGTLIGVGPGRGIGFLFIISGLFVVMIALITSQVAAVRALDQSAQHKT